MTFQTETTTAVTAKEARAEYMAARAEVALLRETLDGLIVRIGDVLLAAIAGRIDDTYASTVIADHIAWYDQVSRALEDANTAYWYTAVVYNAVTTTAT